MLGIGLVLGVEPGIRASARVRAMNIGIGQDPGI